MANTHVLNLAEASELYELPNRGPFAGRERELNELVDFLNEQSPSAQSILLIHGPRGIGKSSLALKAVNNVLDKRGFKTILWMHRSRAEELAIGGPEKNVFSSATINIAAITETEATDFPLHLLHFPKEIADTLPVGYGEKLRAVLARQRPYLLIIDDFDDAPPSQTDDLFRQLAQVKPPNKIILTSRSSKIHFPNPVFRLMELGPLIKEDVVKIILNCHADKFSNVQPLEDVASQVWSISGGHPEFIVQFMAQLLPRRRWLLGQERPEWRETYRRFSAGYLTQHKQEKDPELYLRDAVYRENLTVFKSQIVDWANNRKHILLDVLFALSNQPLDSQEQELAHNLGFLPEEINSFLDAIEELRRLGVIGCRRLLVGVSKQETWHPLVWPFACDLVKEQLDAAGQTNSLLQRRADRWIKFLQANPEGSELHDQQIPNIYDSFRWCVDQADWRRVLEIGKRFSPTLWIFKNRKNYQEVFSKIQYVCEQTLEAFQRAGWNDTHDICQQYIILARLYSDADREDAAKLDIALGYVKKALNVIGSNYSPVWEEVACLIANLYGKRGQIAEAKEWLTRVLQEGNKDYSLYPDWATAAYEISRLDMRKGDIHQAQAWFDKALLSHQPQKNHSTCASTSIEFAYACLLNGDLEHASKYAQTAEGIAMSLYSNTLLTEHAEISILSNAILAEVAKSQNQTDECEGYLQQARDLSKAARLNPRLTDELNGWLEHLIRSTRGFIPARAVASIMDKRLNQLRKRSLEMLSVLFAAMLLKTMTKVTNNYGYAVTLTVKVFSIWIV